MDRALYFPFIEVPDSPALTRVLLYWDQLGTIVPRRAEGEGFGPRTRELVAAGLVTPVHPDEHFEIMGSGEDFLPLVDSLAEYRYRVPNLRNRQGEEARAWSDARTDVIHRDKATSDIWRELVERRLAEPIPHSHGWMRVEPLVGALFMAHLAASLARLPELDMEPITDQRHYLSSADDFVGGSVDTALLFDQLRGAVLQGVLPAPLQQLSPRAIADFKERNWDLLGQFRRDLERQLLACARERDEELRRRMVSTLHDDVADGVAEIRARLRERRWRPGVGMLCAAVAGAPAVAETIVTGDPLPAVGAATAPLAELMRKALTGGTTVEETQPLAFAALAQDEFG